MACFVEEPDEMQCLLPNSGDKPTLPLLMHPFSYSVDTTIVLRCSQDINIFNNVTKVDGLVPQTLDFWFLQ